jgi:hypothetical protein
MELPLDDSAKFEISIVNRLLNAKRVQLIEIHHLLAEDEVQYLLKGMTEKWYDMGIQKLSPSKNYVQK